MIPASFDYVRAGSEEEALAALADPDAVVLAGGHSLLPMMKLRLAQPSRVVDIGALALRGVGRDGDGVRIGALTTYDRLLREGAGLLPDAVLECAAAVGDLQVRNAGTVGGAVAHADPASDLAAGLIATDSTLRLLSPGGRRECAVEDFFLGPFTTALDRPELVTEIVVPGERAGEGSAYDAVENPASGYAIAGAAVKVRLDGARIADCRVGLVGAVTRPVRVRRVEEALAEAGEARLDDCREALADLGRDVLASGDDADYRLQVAAVVICRAAAAARARAGGAVR
jgi:carbon-monoxide dehydrogenase medium subunit